MASQVPPATPPPEDAQLLLVGASELADAIAETIVRRAPGIALLRHTSPFAEADSFALLLDVELAVDASGDLGTRYLVSDAAEIRGIPVIWGVADASGGEVGVVWEEKGIDYRDVRPEGTGEVEGLRPGATPAVIDAVASLVADRATALLAGDGNAFVGRVASFDADGRLAVETEIRRDPAAARPGSLEERTALREPDAERSITPAKLQQLLAGPTTAGIHETPPVLLDVREAPEASFVSLPGSVLIPLSRLADRLGELDPSAPTVVYCHHGVRSARALEVLQKAGFTRIRHLTGGIDAWAVQLDPGMPRY